MWYVITILPYLRGRWFPVVTDHYAMRWLGALKDPVGWLGWWGRRLYQYTFYVKYKYRRLHQDADCLSRYAFDPPDQNDVDGAGFACTISGFLHIIEEHHHSPIVQTIIKNTNQPGLDNSMALFLLCHNILYIRNVRRDGAQLLPVVLQHPCYRALRQLYDLLTAGNISTKPTYPRVYFDYTVLYAGTSGLATSANAEQHELRFQHGSSSLFASRRQFLACRFGPAGPCPVVHRGNHDIAVMTHYATRYTIPLSLQISCASYVAVFLLRDISIQCGAPVQLLTDRRPYFHCRVIQVILL